MAAAAAATVRAEVGFRVSVRGKVMFRSTFRVKVHTALMEYSTGDG